MKKSELVDALSEMPHLKVDSNLPIAAKTYAERYFVYQPILSKANIVREYLTALWEEGHYQFTE